MSFMGSVNVLPSNSNLIKDSGLEHEHPEVFLRPHDVIVLTEPDEMATPARVTRLIHMGSEIQVELALDDAQVVSAIIPRQNFDELQLETQQQVYVKLKDAKAFPFCYSI